MGVIVDEPNWIMKSWCRVGVAGKTRSSVFARLSCRWCSFIHAEMSARQPEIRAATVGSSGSKWEIELCVISIEMVGEAMCLYDGSQWCSVCGEEEGSKNRSLGNPSDQFMCFGYPSPGHPERPTSEIGFKPAKWNPSDIQWWEGWTGGSDDWQCQKRQRDPAEWGLMIWNRLLQFAGLQWQSSTVSVEWPLLNTWLFSCPVCCLVKETMRPG